MIPTALILIFFAALIFFMIYGLVHLSQTGDDSTVKRITRDEFLWGEGYAFATLKVDSADYENLPHIRTPAWEDYQSLDKFSAIICTRDHGTYRSSRMKEVSRTDNEIVFSITFENALGPTIIENFTVLHGDDDGVLSAGFGPDHQHPIRLEKNDDFRITQKLILAGQDES